MNEKGMMIIELDNKEYAIIGEIKINDIPYLHLANVKDPEDFCIRKVIIENGEEIITALDSYKEFEMALEFFSRKHRSDLEI